MQQIDEKEYHALRSELQMRVQMMNTHNVGMLTVVVAIWAVAGVLFGHLFELRDITASSVIVVTILSSLLMLVPTFIITPLAVKSGDNLGQIASIAGYLKVFAELPTFLNKEARMIAWESLQEKEMVKNFHSFFFNSEYFFLSIFSIMFSLGVCLAGCCMFFSLLNRQIGWVVSIVGVFIIFGILFAVITSRSSSSKAFLKSINEYANKYLLKFSQIKGRDVSLKELEYYRNILNIEKPMLKINIKKSTKQKIISFLREMMCSGRLYNPISWDYYNEDGAYKSNPEYFEIMNEYQMNCRKSMNLYNSIPFSKSGEKRKTKILKEIFGEYDGFRKIEAPLHANYGGMHTKLRGSLFANYNLTLIEDGEIEIGDKVMIGPNVVICTAEHPQDIGIRALAQGILYNKKVTIGNNVWIGANVQIFAGATIGDNCIIGAGSIITKETVIPDNKIAYGVISPNIVSELKDIGR